MTLNGVMAVTLRYFTEFGKPALQKRSVAEFMQESIVFLVRVQCRRKETSRSLSHLLLSFLLPFCRHGNVILHRPAKSERTVTSYRFLANVNSSSCSLGLYVIGRPSVCRLSVVCNVGAPYSGD